MLHRWTHPTRAPLSDRFSDDCSFTIYFFILEFVVLLQSQQPRQAFPFNMHKRTTFTLTPHKAITGAWRRPFESFTKHLELLENLQTLTISIFINQLKYPVNHLVWAHQIAFFIQLSMAGFLQPINRLRVTGKYVTTSYTDCWFHFSPLIYLEMFWKLCRSVVLLYDSIYIYYLHNFKKLCFINASTSIFIIHFECPFQLMFQFTPQD